MLYRYDYVSAAGEALVIVATAALLVVRLPLIRIAVVGPQETIMFFFFCALCHQVVVAIVCIATLNTLGKISNALLFFCWYY